MARATFAPPGASSPSSAKPARLCAGFSFWRVLERFDVRGTGYRVEETWGHKEALRAPAARLCRCRCGKAEQIRARTSQSNIWAPKNGTPRYRKLFSSLLSHTYCVSYRPFYSSCHLTCQSCFYLRHAVTQSSPSLQFVHYMLNTPHRSHFLAFLQLADVASISMIAPCCLHIPFKPSDKSSCALFPFLFI